MIDSRSGIASQTDRDETVVLDGSAESTATNLTGKTPPTLRLEEDSCFQQQQNSDRDLLSKAVAAAQSGNRILARLHLEQVVAADPDDSTGWLWLAWVADSPAAALSALQQAGIQGEHSVLIEHGLAWAQGMQAFRLASMEDEPTPETAPVEQCKTHLLPDQCEEPSTAPSESHPITQRLDDVEQVDRPSSTADGLSDSESGMSAPEATPYDASCEQTVHLDEATAPRAAATSPTAPADELASEDDRITEPVEDAHATQAVVEHAPTDSDHQAPACEQPTILAIDDSPTVRSLVSMTLQKSGYKVMTASDGVDALERIKSCKPALILMDINMPKLNGYQLCKLLKKHKETSEIPVIMLSGKDGMFDKLRGNMCGCDDYITKPFKSADLVQKVSSFLTDV
jgi:twitching motility two-component system response regulator PilG